MFSSLTSASLHGVSLFALLSLASALPYQDSWSPPTLNTSSMSLSRRTVYSPPITSPDSTTRWTPGTEVEVTWSTAGAPQSVTNQKGKIILGHLEAGSPSENLDLDHPLAEGFDIMDGHRTITVPQVSPGNQYIVVLFGDSGNRSPEFTIN